MTTAFPQQTSFPQQEMGFMTYPAGPWRKGIFRLPIWLWRLGWGPILGRVLVLLTTRGRRSGLPRRTVVEYLRYGGKKYVVSAFGEKAQWYKNILADPRVTLQTVDGVEAAVATQVTDDQELLGVFDVARRRYPTNRIMEEYFHALGIRDEPADILARKERIHLLRFDPVPEITLPPLDVDLAWIWPATLSAILLACLLRRS